MGLPHASSTTNAQNTLPRICSARTQRTVIIEIDAECAAVERQIKPLAWYCALCRSSSRSISFSIVVDVFTVGETKRRNRLTGRLRFATILLPETVAHQRRTLGWVLPCATVRATTRRSDPPPGSCRRPRPSSGLRRRPRRPPAPSGGSDWCRPAARTPAAAT